MKEWMFLAFLSIGAGVCCSCDRLSKPTQPVEPPPLFRTPSATELFDLQSKCTAMGEKVMEGNVIGNALTQEQVSHYNPKDNRCYVKLDVHTANLTTPREDYMDSDYLYDGQSREMLAYISTRGDKRVGRIWDSGLLKLMQEKKQSDTDVDAISDLIDSFAATDRRP
jgi:hypothetical protein